MVRRWLMLCMATWALVAHADVVPTSGVDDAFDEGTITDKRPFKPGSLRSFTIQFDGRHPGADKPVFKGCEGFAPTHGMVREYFRKARQVSARAYTHDEDWSHCEAAGTFSYRDGRSGQWRIQQYGLGVLLIEDKKVYLHCEDCTLVRAGGIN